MRYQIWGDNTGSKHGFQSYVNGYIDNKDEAIKTFNRYKREYKSYHRLELHELNGRLFSHRNNKMGLWWKK